MRARIIGYRFHNHMGCLSSPVLLRVELELAQLQRTKLQAETLTRDDTSSIVHHARIVHLATLALNGKESGSQVTWYRAARFIRSYDLVVIYCAEPTGEGV